MGRKTNKALVYFLWISLLAACKKDKPPEPDVAPPAKVAHNVYVVCEGNYGFGNASLSLYVPSKDSVYDDIYKAVNNQSLGDVFQSMQRIGAYYFLCINNSDKVVVLDTAGWTLVAGINIPKPRYILPINETKAYVSTLYSNKLYIINPQTLQITGTIAMPAQNPEGMLLDGSTAYICTWDTACQSLYAINTATDNIERSYTLTGRAPQGVLMDKEHKLWVLAGNITKGKVASLTRLDPATGQVLSEYMFPGHADPLRPVFNNTRDTLYFVEANYYGQNNDHNGIYRMSIYDAALPQQPFVAGSRYQYFWGVDIEPATGNIYIGDPKGFTQRGSVYIYSPDGTQVTSFTTGVGPGHFYFDE